MNAYRYDSTHTLREVTFLSVSVPTNMWIDLSVRVGGGKLRVGAAAPSTSSLNGSNPTIVFACTGLVDVDPDTGEFEPSALYRVLRHIGPFVKRGARLLHVDGERDGTATVLFRNPDGSHALVIGCSGRAEGRDDTPRARVHVKFRDEWLSVPLPIDVWSLTTVVFAEKA